LYLTITILETKEFLKSGDFVKTPNIGQIFEFLQKSSHRTATPPKMTTLSTTIYYWRLK